MIIINPKKSFEMNTINHMDKQSRITELEAARLSVISMSKDAPDEKEWVSSFRVANVHYTVNGYAYRKRPYGVDGDLMLALQTLFVQAGCPENNRISISPRQLCLMSRLSDSSKEYVRMREGLLRLASVRWEMSARWMEHGKMQQRTNASGLISDLWLDDNVGLENEIGVRVSDDASIIVVLTATLADSIRQGMYQILNGDLLRRLKTSNARSLYCALAAHRTKDEHLLSELNVNLREWVSALGLNEDPKYALRSLNVAHEKLIAEGYIDHVTDEGRGEKRTLTYHFHRAAQPEHVEALTAKGVGSAVAASLSADHPERIYPALRCVEEKLGSGWKPRSLPAAIVDAVRNPGKWGYAAQEITPVPTKQSRKKKEQKAEVAEAPLDPRETVRNLLKLRLRAESTVALRAVDQAGPEQLQALKAALSQGEINVALVETILGCRI